MKVRGLNLRMTGTFSLGINGFFLILVIGTLHHGPRAEFWVS